MEELLDTTTSARLQLEDHHKDIVRKSLCQGQDQDHLGQHRLGLRRMIEELLDISTRAIIEGLQKAIVPIGTYDETYET